VIDHLTLKFLKELEYEPILEMLSKTNSGKKLRSKLLLSISGESEKAFILCAIIELIHLASLLHDDIIDEAELRRNAKSVNAHFGAKNALMLGDILYSKAFYELSKFDDKEFASIISSAVVKLSIGELMDVRLSESFNEDKEAYLQMIYNKTAVLIQASARCGARLAGLDEESFALYGKNLGLAFQVIDDILDLKNDEKTLGKPAMNDYKEGKTTLPYIYLYESLDQENKAKLKSLFKKELNQEENLWIKQMLKQNQILEKTFLQARNYGSLALEAIANFNNPKLEEIIYSMIDREF